MIDNNFTEQQIEIDLNTRIRDNTITDNYIVYTLFFPGENLEPIYEGYDEPSYYDYTFPAKVKLYRLTKETKWLLLQERLMNENEYHDIEKIDFRTLPIPNY